MISPTEETVVAGRAGTYRETGAVPPLSGHFQCAWTNVIHRDTVGRIAIVPDGCVDLVWMDDRIVVAGPDLSAAYPALRPGMTVIGLRFQPGAALNWLGLPMTEIAGHQVDLGDLWGAKARDIAGMIAETDTAEARLRLWQSRLLPGLSNIDPPGSDIRMIFELTRENRAQGSKIRRILDRLEISERTLRRRCHEHFGYGPKALDRILRFQNVLRVSRADPHATLSAIAFDTGYADQAHLSRDVRDLCGLSAGELVRQLAD